MLTSIFTVVILLWMLLIVFNFRTWAIKRDTYYSNKILEFEERIKMVEEKNIVNLIEMLRENKELLEKIKNKVK